MKINISPLKAILLFMAIALLVWLLWWFFTSFERVSKTTYEVNNRVIYTKATRF